MTECTTLDSGVRVVTDRMEHVASAAVGFYVATGSRHEDPDEAGISHFIEHILFKGTETRSVKDIVLAFDAVGGDINAATEREVTAFYGRLPGEHVAIAVDVLGEMILRPKLAEEDIELELLVVEEEIKRYEDTPSELVHDHFVATLWPEEALGRPILGNMECLRRMSPERIRACLRRRYAADRLIVSAAGNVRHQGFVELVQDRLAGIPTRAENEDEDPTPAGVSAAACEERDIEQVHLCIGVVGCSIRDDWRFAQAVADCAIGGSASSRLFQEVRENRGLVYSIFSSAAMHTDTGYLSIYAGTRPENAKLVLELIRSEMADVLDNSLTLDEIHVAKEHHRGATRMALDSVGHRMARAARSLLAYGRVIPPEEVISRIEAVSAYDVRETTRRLFCGDSLCIAAIGPIQPSELCEASGLPPAVAG